MDNGRMLARSEAQRRRVAGGDDDFAPAREKAGGDLADRPESARLRRLAARRARPTDGMTAGQRHRYKRDLLITWAHLDRGLSQRWLAEAFGLPRSRIQVIVRNIRARAGRDDDGDDDE